MPTINSITDEYILRAKVEDTMAPALDTLATKLNVFEKAAASGQAAAAKLGQQMTDSAGRQNDLASQFEKAATKYDLVTKAGTALLAAQRELQQTTDAGTRAVANNLATQEQLDSTISALVQKVDRLATAYGQARAAASAAADAQDAWNGKISNGDIGGYAAKVASAAQNTASLTAQITAWNAATVRATESQRLWNATSGVITDDEANRRTAERTADMEAFSASVVEQRAALIPLIATSKAYSDAMAAVDDALKLMVISQAEATLRQEALTAAYAAANQPLQGLATRQEELDAILNTYNASVVRATEAQRLWNATSGVITDAEAARRTAERAADMDALTQNTLAQRAALIPLIATSKAYSDAMAELDANVATSVISQDEATIQQEALTAAYAAANQPLQNQIAGQKELDTVIRASFQALDSYEAGLDAIQARRDPAFRANQAYNKSLSETKDLLDAGRISTSQASAANADASKVLQLALNPTLDTTTKQVRSLTAEHNLQTFAARQLGVQSVQLTTMIATGSPVWMALIQQGHQLLDVSLATGTGFEVLGKAISSALGWVVSPVGLAVTSMVALGAATYTAVSHSNALETQSRTMATAIDGVGRSAKVSTEQMVAYADQLARNSNLSRVDATKALAQAIGTPGVSQANVGSIATLAPNLSAALGISETDAIKQLTDAYAGNYAAMQKLMASSNDFSQAQVTQVRNFLEQGNRAAAMKLIVDQLSVSMADAHHKSLSPMDEAFKQLGTSWNEFADRVAKSAPVVAIMEQFRKATLGWADLLKTDTGDVSRQIVTLNTQALALQDTLSKQQSLGIKDPQTAQKLHDVQAAIDVLIAKGQASVAQAVAAPSANAATPDPSKPTAEEQARISAQSIAIDAQTKKYQDQAAVLAASLPTRAAVAAAQAAEADAVTKGYNAADIATAKQAAFTAAMKQASDAAIQEAAAQDRATGYAVRMASAIDSGRVAAYQASAAIEAHEKAVTQAGVSEAALTQIILTRNAAQAVQKSSQDVSDQQVQLDLQQKVLDATDERAAHEQEVANKVALTTQAMVDQAAASGNPALINQAKALVDLETKRAQLIDQRGVAVANRNIIEQTNRETDAQIRINSAWDGSATSLTHLQNVEKARAALFTQTFDSDTARAVAIKKTADAYDLGSEAARRFQQEQASVSAVSSAFSEAFSTIGNAISQAFIQGQGAAVNWGNVLKSVISQVIQKVAELAVVNPILNSLFGSNNGTLQTAISVLGSGTSSGSSTVKNADGTFSLVSSGGTVLSTASTLSGLAGGPTIGSMLGLTGEGGLLTGTGASISAGLFGTAGTAAASETSMLAADSLAGAYGAAPTAGLVGSGGMLAGASLSSWAGGITGGFALGSMAGSLVQGALGKTGPAPMIGAGLGAVGGAAIGTAILPGIGTVIGGLLGGTLGGAGGGLIGPHIASTYSTASLSLDDGRITKGPMIQQGEMARAAAEDDAMTAALANIGKMFTATGVRVTDQLKQIQIGDNSNFSAPDPTKYADLATKNMTGETAFQQFRFGSTIDPILNDKLKDKVFLDPDEMQKWLTAFETAQDGVKIYLTDTAKVMKDLGATSGSLTDTLKGLTDAYAVDKKAMDALLAGGMLSEQQTTDLTKAETDLATIRDRSIKIANDAALAQVGGTNRGFESRYLSASATLSGNAGDSQTAALYNFDSNAVTERAALKSSLVSIWGDSITTTSWYAREMAALDKTLAQERLAVAVSSNKAILSSTTSFIKSLADYVTNLKLGANSPLSPTEQLRVARENFARTSKAAAGGDAAAMQSFQGDSNNLLSIAKSYYGSSTGYVAAFNEVIDTASKIQALGPDVLTASFLAQQTKDQTASLVDELERLRLAIVGGSSVTDLAGSAATGGAQSGGGLSGGTSGTSTGGAGFTPDQDFALRGPNYSQVSDAYQFVLGRAPDAGAEAWVTQLNNGLSATDLTAKLAASPEAIGQQAATVQKLFQSELHRAAEQSAVDLYGARLASHEWTADRLKQELDNSSEHLVMSLFLSELGRMPDQGANDLYRSMIAKGLTADQLKAMIDASPEYQALHHAAGGGWIGNGIWGKDSVRAGYAGGGSVALAGGEFVVSAPSAARYAAVLPAINAGSYASGGANDNAIVVSELRALRTQSTTTTIMETRVQTGAIVDAITDLKAELAALRRDIGHGDRKPARLSA